jgi:hypothetical protein
MSTNSLHHRLATRDDIVVLTALMNASIGELQKPFLTDAQIASSRAIMGLDTQLIDDGTYFVVRTRWPCCCLRRMESAGNSLWGRQFTRARCSAA